MNRLLKPPPGCQLDRGHPLAHGLVGAWLFNEGGGGTAWDLSGTSHHGTLTNMSPGSDWNPLGLEFRGSPDRIDCGGAVVDGTPATLEVLCRYHTTTNMYPLMIGVIGDNFNNFSIRIQSNNIYARTRDGVGDAYAQKAGFSTNVWYHIVAQFVSDSYRELYVGGRRVATDSTVLGSVSGSDNTVIGCWRGNAVANFDGDIQFARIYNRALDPTEIRALYLDPYQMFRPVSGAFHIEGAVTRTYLAPMSAMPYKRSAA